MAQAMDWVTRIATVAAVMVLPGIGGQWLDKRFGLGFLGLAGFAVGITAGIWYLLLITRRGER